MMARVAIDAATDRLTVAAESDGKVAETHLDGARRHGGALLRMLEEVLGEVGARPGDVSDVIVADGPGSFTGLRVSFAAALALVRDGATLWTAPSLLARATAAATASTPRVLVLGPALRGEAWAGAWHIDPGRGIELVLHPRPIGRDEAARLPAVDLIIGECPDAVARALPRPPAGPYLPDARTLLRLMGLPGGARRVTPETFQPEYGRPAEAQAKWERDHGRPLPDPGRPDR